MNAFKHILILTVSCCFVFKLNAQTRQTPKQYKEKFDQDAVAEMIKSGVPASITLAQGMLESDYGNSALAKKSTKPFWNKMSFQLDGWQILHGRRCKRRMF